MDEDVTSEAECVNEQTPPVKKGRFPTFVVDLLRSRLFCLTLLGVTTGIFLLYLFDLPTWRCPMKMATGLDCPGCGMTRAAGLLVHGEIAASLKMHPFVLFYAIAWLIVVLCAILPEKARRSFVDAMIRIDSRFGVTILVISSQLIWGLIRLIRQIIA